MHTNCKPTPCVATPVAASRGIVGQWGARRWRGGKWGAASHDDSRVGRKGFHFRDARARPRQSNRSLLCQAAHCSAAPLTVVSRRSLFCHAAHCSVAPLPVLSCRVALARCSVTPLTVLPRRSLFCHAAPCSVAPRRSRSLLYRTASVSVAVRLFSVAVLSVSVAVPSVFGRRRHRLVSVAAAVTDLGHIEARLELILELVQLRLDLPQRREPRDLAFYGVIYDMTILRELRMTS